MGRLTDAANRIFEYLCVRDAEPGNADLIIGFGHFDLRIPRLCGQLYEKGLADKILFTGGRGSGTADLADAEALEFRKALFEKYPAIPDEAVIAECGSSNTGENIRMSAEILREINREFCFEDGLKTVIAVASPYRQRRVWRTIQQIYPEISVINYPPRTSFEEEVSLFEDKNQNLIPLLAGEIDRILNYPKNGFMAAEIVPQDILDAYDEIQSLEYEKAGT